MWGINLCKRVLICDYQDLKHPLIFYCSSEIQGTVGSKSNEIQDENWRIWIAPVCNVRLPQSLFRRVGICCCDAYISQVTRCLWRYFVLVFMYRLFIRAIQQQETANSSGIPVIGSSMQHTLHSTDSVHYLNHDMSGSSMMGNSAGSRGKSNPYCTLSPPLQPAAAAVPRNTSGQNVYSQSSALAGEESIIKQFSWCCSLHLYANWRLELPYSSN